MKHRLLVLAALAPLAATASEGESLQSKIDVQQLQENLRATDVIDADVMRNGEDAGDVEDVIISTDGRVEAVLVDGLDDGNNDAAQQPVSVPREKTDDIAGAGMPTDEGLQNIPWSQVSYDPQEDSVQLESGGQAQMSRTRGSMLSSQQASPDGGGSTFRASDIIGMEVHLSDADSFGEVEDLLIDAQQGKTTALLVDAWEGFDKQTYALPVELDAVNREDNTLSYEYTESEVKALQEYEER